MEPLEFKKLAIEFLRLFAITWKNLWLYSEYHPLGKSSLKKCFDILLIILRDRSEFSIGTAEDKILAEEIIIEEEKYVMSSIAKELSERNIFSLVFFRGISREDFKALFYLLVMRPEQLMKMGGLSNLIEQRGIQFIQSNTVRYGKITESQELVDIALADHILTGATVSSSPTPASFATTKPSSRPMSGISSVVSPSLSLEELMNDPVKISSLFAKTLEQHQSESRSGPATRENILSSLQHIGKILQDQSGGQWNKLKTIYARLLLSLKPEIQKYVIEQSQSETIKDSFLKNFISYIPEEHFSDLIVSQFKAGLKEPRELAHFILTLLPSREKREKLLYSIRKKLLSAGASDEVMKKIQEEMNWHHLSTREKTEKLLAGELIWKKPFLTVMEIIEEISQTPSKNEAMMLIQKYISGLIHSSLNIRKDVIHNAIPLYIFMKGRPDFSYHRFNIQNLFFRRLKDEQHMERFEDLVKSIMATAAAEIDTGNYSESIRILEKLKLDALRELENDPRKRDLVTNEITQMASEDFLKNILEEYLQSPKELETTLPKFFELFGRPSIPFLTERLGSEKNRKKRFKITALLKSMKQEALPMLLKYLEDDRWYLVRNVIFIIGEIADPIATKFLAPSLHHPDHKVRRETVRALIKMGGDEALASIADAMSDPDPSAAMTAMRFLGRKKHPKAIQKMLLIASKEHPFDEVEDLLRISAIEILGNLKLTEAIPACIQIIKKKKLLGIMEDANLRRAAVKALAEIGGEQAREALIFASEKDPLASIRRMARDAILEG